MPGRIPWSTYSGEEVEKAIAAYICLENRRAVRIRPSQGDRGIDLISREAEGVTVYQVKKFSSNLSFSQKSQILDSWNALQKHVSSTDMKLSEWRLVMPLDPTPENEQWLRDLGGKADVNVQWDGLARIDAWAAKWPEVADYFFADGKEREREVFERLMQIAQLENPDSPDELLSQLSALQRHLDEINPFYSFSISLRSKFENARAIPALRPGLVMAFMESLADGSAIVVEVFAKFEAAADLCPITFNVSSVADNEESRLAFENLLHYGTPMRDVPAVLMGPSMELPLPLASHGEEGLVSAIQIESGKGAPCSLSWNSILSIPLVKRHAHFGDSGFEWAGKDRTGFMEITLRQDSRQRTSTCTINVNHSRLGDGWDPRELKRTLDFMAAGITSDVDFIVGESKALRLPLRDLGIPLDYIQGLLSFADDIIEISEHVTAAFELPAIDTLISPDAANAAILNQILVASPPEPETWFSSLREVCDHFKEANGLQ